MRHLSIRFTVRQVIAASLVAAGRTVAAYADRGFCWYPLPLTEAEAIQLAERFIAQNGYTDLSVPEGTKLTLEPRASSISEHHVVSYNLM